MNTLIRDNPVVTKPRVFTAMTCTKCNELYETDRIHICCKRNSYPDVAKDTIIKRPKPKSVQSDILLDTIESYCDNEDKISFELVYEIVEKLRDGRKK